MRHTILSACTILLLGPGLAAAAECAPASGAEFICGVDNVEDFAQLPDGRIIGSDLAVPGKQGFFFVFKPDRSVQAIPAEDITIAADPAYSECPGAPDWKQFGPHGLDAAVNADTGTLYAVNHGGREAIEIFGIELTAEAPKLTWKGCLIAPKGAWPDDVAALPDGGLAVTSLWDPEDNSRADKLVAGKPVGGLYEWHPAKGWSVVRGSESMSGPNGVIATPDGTKIYVAAWSGKQIIEFDRKTGDQTVTDVDFFPDNLNWSADKRTILATGIAGSIPDALACFGSSKVNCPETGVRVDRYDPASRKTETVVPAGIYGEFGAATGAIDVGKEVWVNSFRSDRIAVFPRH